MLDHGLADGTPRPGDDVDGTRWESRFVYERREVKNAQRRDDRWFHYHRVSACNRCRETARHELERRIPGNDLTDYAERFAHDEVDASAARLKPPLSLVDESG